MEVSFSNSFKKSAKKKFRANPELENEFWVCVQMFVENPYNPVLKTHKLSGKLRFLWSFSIDFENRVVFYFTDQNPKQAVFVDIGTHNEVY